MKPQQKATKSNISRDRGKVTEVKSKRILKECRGKMAYGRARERERAKKMQTEIESKQNRKTNNTRVASTQKEQHCRLVEN